MRISGKAAECKQMYDPDFHVKIAQIIAGKTASFGLSYQKTVFVSWNYADFY